MRRSTASAGVNERLTQAMEGYMQRQDAINARLTQSIEGIELTQAQIETLRKRVLRPDTENGREA